jgi:hypothetical protein
MPVLRNHRHEIFSQNLAQGKTADAPYQSAGYKSNRANACRLKANESVIGRVLELQASEQERFVLTRKCLLEALIENIEKALSRRPVKIGEGKPVYVYRGDVANRAIQLAGLEVGLFSEHKEIKHTFEFDKMSDVELVQELEREARLLLEHDSGGSDGENGDAGA